MHEIFFVIVGQYNLLGVQLKQITEWSCQVIALQPSICEVLSSNLGCGTEDPD
jgi:hypothetical protein